MDVPFIQVHSEEVKNEYDTVLLNVCEALLNHVFTAAGCIVNEKNEQVTFNVADVCNTLTNVLQKHRAAHAQAAQV